MDYLLADLLRRATRTAGRASKVHHHCAMAVRADGARVYAVNDTYPGQRNWRAHAEARLCRKLTPKSVVFVVRLRRDGSLANSRPCETCLLLMRRSGVRMVIFSAGAHDYGVIKL